MEVTQRGAGANLSVDVSIGACVIRGDDQPNQGMYFARITAIENSPAPAAPGSDQRWDVVSLRINDPTAGGPAGNNATLVWTQGIAGPTPVPPSVPTSAIGLASVLRTAGEPSIIDDNITDIRPLGGGALFGRVSSAAPTTDDRGVAGDLWIRVA